VENIRDAHPRQLLDLARAIAAPNLGLSLDIGHANLYGTTYALDEWALALAPALRHIHLHDNDGRFDRHWGIGSGTMAFRPFLETVASIDPAPRVTIEASPRDDAWRTLEHLIAEGWHTPRALSNGH
jgi:sugar phosphate isomerase/epimerase